MIFQWHDHVAADRFKNTSQRGYGPNGVSVDSQLWVKHILRPLHQFQGQGARLETYKLELRAVPPRIRRTKETWRDKSGSKRLSMMAVGLGEKVSGIWR